MHSNTWSLSDNVWNGAKHLTQRTAMNNNLAAVSCMFSQLGVMSKDLFVILGEVSMLDGIIFPESGDLRENPLPLSEEIGDKLWDENENNGGGGGITFCKVGEFGILGGLDLSVLSTEGLLLLTLLSILFTSFLPHMVLSAIKDNKL